MDGVMSVKTDTVNHFAEVVFDDTRTSAEQMKILLAENGYPVESVRNERSSPAADAGPDRDAEPGKPVMLDGSASSDPDGDISTYLWEQTEGMPVNLSDTSAIQPEFTAPAAGTEGTVLTFQLTVTDSIGFDSRDSVTVHIVGKPEISTFDDLKIRAVIHTVEKGPIDAVWQKSGEDTTEGGHRVVWGYFYASPDDVNWGSPNNPDVFVKIWFDAGGRIDVNFFHVSVPDIDVYSDYLKDTKPELHGKSTLDRRYIRQYYENGESYSDESPAAWQ